MQLIPKALDILKTFAPLAIFVMAVITAWGVVKWGTRLSEAFKGLFESPERIIFLLIVVGLFLWIYFDKIAPLL